MRFKDHSELADRHAFLSPSNYHWLNYDEVRLEERFRTHKMAVRGTALHEFCHMAIQLGVKLPSSRKTLHLYVNDAIGYKMTVEQSLYYSDNCFGHADTMSFRRGKLRIHDLKTGSVASSFRQLEIYAALFCLEYMQSPYDIEIELRLYQNDDVRIFEPTPEGIEQIMNKIVNFDMQIEEMKEAGR